MSSVVSKESPREHRAGVVTCMKFVLCMKPSRAPVKMVSCVSSYKVLAKYLIFLQSRGD